MFVTFRARMLFVFMGTLLTDVTCLAQDRFKKNHHLSLFLGDSSLGKRSRRGVWPPADTVVSDRNGEA